ncbi:hypothetical protein PR048_000521 [Dryococelus australis]|uniref:Uncharacterized protein n=1 Tax=Dryococelus australis TaxID=614101 RepID=A0ABQ9IEW9_9NEOP|nr:hypothetical protein PR048_000521 [Dryococelus australis]
MLFNVDRRKRQERQHRDWYLFVLLLAMPLAPGVSFTHLQVVEHKFFEKSRAYMNVDSMSSAIECAMKYVPEYSMQD